MWPDSQHSFESVTPDLGKQKRRKSFGHDSAEVVTTGMSYPSYLTHKVSDANPASDLFQIKFVLIGKPSWPPYALPQPGALTAGSS